MNIDCKGLGLEIKTVWVCEQIYIGDINWNCFVNPKIFVNVIEKNA